MSRPRRGTRRSSSSTDSPPNSPNASSSNYSLPILSQVIKDIQNVHSRLKLNKSKYRSLENMCLYIFQTMPTSPKAKNLLRSIHTQGKIWTSAGLLRSLTQIPNDMDAAIQECTALGASQTITEYDQAEVEAIVSAIKKIFSDKQQHLNASKLRGQEAKLFVTHIQLTLETVSETDALREDLHKTQRKICKEAEVLPQGLEIPHGALSISEPLGLGGSCTVYKAVLAGKTVAAKRLSERYGIDTCKEFRREVLQWWGLRHPGILRLLGISMENQLFTMVSEYMPNGALNDFLKKPEYEETSRLAMIYQVAQALKYLHERKPLIAHGDIKANNVFVDATKRPVIGDFGLSCNHYVKRTMSTTLKGGTTRWMAPELLLPDDSSQTMQRPTAQSDIYAVGMLMLELFTDAVPYDGDPDPVVIINVIGSGKTPPRPGKHITERGLTDDVWGVMEGCWKKKPSDRVTIDAILHELDGLSKSVKPTAWKRRTDLVLVPTTLMRTLIDSENLKNIMTVLSENPVNKQTEISLTGNALSNAEAQVFISAKIDEIGGIPITDKILIPERFHSALIGYGGKSVKSLQKKHKIKIQFPDRKSHSDVVILKGHKRHVESGKEDLKKSVEFERKLRDELEIQVSPRVAEVLSERQSDIRHPQLWEMIVDISSGRVILKGKPTGLTFAKDRIEAIEKQVERVTEEVSIDSFLLDIIQTRPQFWTDIVQRCGAQEPSTQLCCHWSHVGPGKLQIRGPPELVRSVRIELGELMDVGHACVAGKRIKSYWHDSLIGSSNTFLKDLRQRAGAMAYFPGSGGYADVGVPDNIHDYENDPPGDIVKLVGSEAACVKARDDLAARVKELKTKLETNAGFEFPANIHHKVKSLVESYFAIWCISIEAESAPAGPTPLIAIASQTPDDITDSSATWTIYRDQDSSKGPFCQWKLKAKSSDGLKMARKYLKTAIQAARKESRRIGILRLKPPHLRIVKNSLDELREQSDGILLEIESPGNVVLAGPSTDDVRLAIKRVIGVVELHQQIE